jgi:hypothetical protein
MTQRPQMHQNLVLRGARQYKPRPYDSYIPVALELPVNPDEVGWHQRPWFCSQGMAQTRPARVELREPLGLSRLDPASARRPQMVLDR